MMKKATNAAAKRRSKKMTQRILLPVVSHWLLLVLTSMMMMMIQSSLCYAKDTTITTTSAAAAAATTNNINNPPPPLECDLYIAESTIPNAGLGIFTAIEKKVGDTIGNGDVCFPLLDLDWNNLWEDGIEWEEEEYFNPFKDYVWDGMTMGMGAECDGEVTAVWPGLDCAINCNIPLENVKRAFPLHQSHGDVGLDEYMPHRSRDPNAGSITPYRSGKTLVIRDIPIAGELFKFYGDNWFLTREELFGDIPLLNDFPTVQEFIDRYDQIGFTPLYDLLLEFHSIWNTSRTLNALPQTPEDLALAIEKDISYIYQANATRSVEWLQKHGKCIDHIVHKASTIPGAGEGAFAKRKLPRGTLITGSPLLHAPNANLFDMYYFELVDEDEDEWDQKAYDTKQVILNYCLGHKDSTLLLFPYGGGINYINHASGDRANVRLQWAEHGTSAHDASWLEMAPEDMEFVWSTKLGIDYVAIRDIEEGEELFMDYGEDWENAWNAHVERWTSPEEVTTAADWNTKFKDIPIRTRDELVYSPYPATVQVRCHVDLRMPDWAEQNLQWDRYLPFTEEMEMVYGLPCNILSRSPDNSTYTVEIWTDRYFFIEDTDLPEDFVAIRPDVPREAIFFMDSPYQSDLYLEKSFRHPIGIPDHMMPEVWKNKLITAAEEDDEAQAAESSGGSDEL